MFRFGFDRNHHGYKTFLIIYKIHSFYFYTSKNYYACIGSRCEQGDRSQGDGLPVPTPIVHGSAAASVRRAVAVCALCRHFDTRLHIRGAWQCACLDGLGRCDAPFFDRAGQPSSLGLLPFKVSACPASFVHAASLSAKRSVWAPFFVWRCVAAFAGAPLSQCC